MSVENTDRLIEEIIEALNSAIMVVDIGDVNDILAKRARVNLDYDAIRVISDQAGVALSVEHTWKQRMRVFFNKISR